MGAGGVPVALVADVEPPDPEGDGNGLCDVCEAVIEDQAVGPRLCSEDPTHDPYSDGFTNGDDPYVEHVKVIVWRECD